VQHRRVLPTSPFDRTEPPPPSTDGYLVGGRVTHDHLGMGRILAVGPEFITIDFGSGTVHTLRPETRGLQRL